MFTWFQRQSIARKLMLAMGLLGAMLLAVSALSSMNAYIARGAVDILSQRADQSAEAVLVTKTTYEGRLRVWRALAIGEDKGWGEAADVMGRARTELKKLIEMTDVPEWKAQAQALAPLYEDYLHLLDNLRPFQTYAASQASPQGVEALSKAAARGNEIIKRLEDLVKTYSDSTEQTETAARATSALALEGTVALTVLSMLLAVGMGFAAIRGISGPIRELTAATTTIAGGELSQPLARIDENNEIGELARAVEILRKSALERQRLESETGAMRAASEAERERTAADRYRAAEEQARVLGALGSALKKLADGDLTTRMTEAAPAQFAAIREDFNSAATRLMQTVSAVVEAAGTIQSGAAEIASATDELSQRTERQAANLEQTTAAVGEIANTLRKSADGTRHASDAVSTANSNAKSGTAIVKQAVEAMDSISQSSRQIGQIIGVIDEIAFQTNLLALNAGVEAARAGEAGRGFAVVASEVRALAQRAAEAAKEIKQLIATSSVHVDAGVALVADTGKALQDIMTQVSEINEVVAEIANSADSQANGLREVNAAINEMDQATQQNATMVEETTAASHKLSQESRKLAQLVEVFRCDGPAMEGQLRRELKAAAPHAFAKREPAPARRPAAPAAPVRPRAAAAAAGGARDDWDEF